MESKRILFKFYRSYFDVAEELNDKDRLAFYDALMKRQFLGIETELIGISKLAYISQKHNIDAQIKGWEDKTKLSLTNANKGGMQGGMHGGSIQLKEEEEEEVYNINNKLLSEIEISDVEVSLQNYFIIAKNFQELFIRNLTEKSISTVTQKNAKFKNYVTPIRLMIENNECTLQDLRDVWSYLSSPKSEFWKKNILSTTKLREQIVKLIFETKKQ
jgi:hypothetical protein